MPAPDFMQAPPTPPVPPRAPVPVPPTPPPVPVVPTTVSTTPWLDRARERSAKEGPLSVIDQEIARILSLPIIGYDTPRCPDRVAYAKTLTHHVAPADFRLNIIQTDAAYTYEQYGGLFGPQGVGFGKCGRENTEFLDVITGLRRSLGEVGECMVHSLGKSKRISMAEAVCFASGEKECYRLELQSGRWVEMSHDHPVLCARGWVYMSKLQVDDLVAVPNKIRHQGTAVKWSIDSVRLCGYLIADGGLTHNQCKFTDNLDGTLSDVENLVLRHGGSSTRRPEKSKSWTVCIRGLLSLVREWGINVLSKRKRVPAWMWGMADEYVWAFFGALFTCDGSLNATTGGVDYSTSSEGLMRDVHHLLQRLGIHGQSRFKMAKCGTKRFPAWIMTITGKDAYNFLTGTGSWVGQPERYVKCMSYHVGNKYNTNVDVVPVGREQLKEIYRELGYKGVGGDPRQRKGRPCTELRERLGATDGQWVGRENFSAWARESGYDGKYAWLANGEMRWQRVKTIQPIGVHKVYDLSVPGPHNFVGNGIVLHNTLLTLLCAKIALQRRGHYRVMLLVPPEVYSQLATKDLPQARRWLALDAIPFWLVKGDVEHRRRTTQQPGPGCWIHSYSSISTKTGFEEILAISPTLVICDEAHNLANPTSARTKRWNNALVAVRDALLAGKLGPDVKAKELEVVALSGTITKKKIADYAHLARWCLKEQAPVPIRDTAVEAFGAVINADVSGTIQTDLDRKRMDELIVWAKEQGRDPYARQGDVGLTVQEATREAYQYRLRTAPGVVATTDASVDCSLIISWAEPQRPSTVDAERMVELMRKVVEEMVTPDGDVIEFGMHSYKWLWELTGGFYNSLTWPTATMLKARWANNGKVLSDMECEALLQGALNHNKLLQKYHRLLRVYLDGQHHPGCDSPMLVGAELKRLHDGHPAKHPIPSALRDAWEAQKAAHYSDLPERGGQPVRICSYKVDAAVAWCKAHEKVGGLIWYHHPAIGNWLHEKLTAAEIPHTFAAAGKNEAAYNDGLVICSYSHATGKNLQKQSHNLILEIRREAHVAEQMLGRTHRQGQKADDVRVDVIVSNGFDLAVFNALIRDADYAQMTTGMKQRLCYATYAPVVPPTNPRLLTRLGITPPGEYAKTRDVTTYQGITPPEALNFSDVFRSLAYVAPVGT